VPRGSVALRHSIRYHIVLGPVQMIDPRKLCKVVCVVCSILVFATWLSATIAIAIY
jgi:hypothetical protein